MADANASTGEQFEDVEGRDIENNLKSKRTWVRFLYMLVFLLVANLVAILGLAVVGLNFLIVLITGQPNERLKGAGGTIASYMAEIVRFLSYNSDTKPFPFDSELPKE